MWVANSKRHRIGVRMVKVRNNEKSLVSLTGRKPFSKYLIYFFEKKKPGHTNIHNILQIRSAGPEIKKNLIKYLKIRNGVNDENS